MRQKQVPFMLFLGALSTMSFLLGVSFQTNYQSVMIVAILPGIVVGTVCTSGSKTLIPLSSGALLGGLLSEQFLFGGITGSGLFISVLHVIALCAMSLFGCFILKKKQVSFDKLHKFSQIPLFLGFVSLTVIVYSLVMSIDIVVVEDTYWMRFLNRVFSAGLFGGIFGSVIFNSYYHDQRNVRDYSIMELVKRYGFTVLFTLVTIYIFSENVVLATYKEMIVVLGMMYFLTAFLFAIRMLFVNNVIVIFVYYIMYYPDPLYQTNEQIFVLALYLIVMTAVTNITRLNYLERNHTIHQLKTAQESMEQLIVSTNNLFSMQDKLPQYKDKFSKEYLRDMFHIACNLYPNFDRATCYIKGQETVEFVGTVGYDLEYLNQLRFDPTVFDWTLTEPSIVYETSNENAFPMEGDLRIFNETYQTITESLRFTVYIGDESYGGMSFDIINGSVKHFGESDIDHFRTFQNLMNSYYSIGESKDTEDNLKNHIVLSILDSYNLIDEYTGYHSQEVAELASELGAELRLKTDDVKTLYWAGLVHDIGKMGVNQSVLNKKTLLTDSEFEMLKLHPVFASKILKQYPSMEKISTIVLHHHEWWNGTGYPKQLKAMAIPYLSQILHVADAVSAMSRDRGFKSAKTNTEIIQELKAGFGTQFSPKVVRVMIQYIEQGKLDELKKRNQK
jgi:putative nucleotidyltransferase with HDIG domain